MPLGVFVYFVGTAGSGKSLLTSAFKAWLEQNDIYAVTVNMDPGVEHLEYTPNVDIREWISLSEVMDEFGLGPNGAQIVAADMLAVRAKEVAEILEGFKADYFLVDTPGQIELFAFRKSSDMVLRTLEADRNVLAFLYDSGISPSPSVFISQIMLSATVHFRFWYPMVHLLTKVDLLPGYTVDKIVEWSRDPDALLSALEEEKGESYALSYELLKLLENMGLYGGLRPVSGYSLYGLEDLYAAIQDVFMAGEDLRP